MKEVKHSCKEEGKENEWKVKKMEWSVKDVKEKKRNWIGNGKVMKVSKGAARVAEKGSMNVQRKEGKQENKKRSAQWNGAKEC